MPKANSTDSGYAYCEFPFVLSNLGGVLLCNSFIPAFEIAFEIAFE